MASLTSLEAAALERCADAPMLDQVLAWAAVNSGSRNLDGLDRWRGCLPTPSRPCRALLDAQDPAQVEAMAADGAPIRSRMARNLHLKVRPEAPVQLLLTGHMDTVFGADHPFQALIWLDDGVLSGPGVADMKGGHRHHARGAESGRGEPLARRLGYEVVINSDEEVGSLGSAHADRGRRSGKRAALTYEPAALPDGTLAGARPGSGNFSLVVHGRSAHAGRNPEDGRNALIAAADLALRLDQARAPGLSINPARIDGGGPNNVVPGPCGPARQPAPGDCRTCRRGQER